MNEMQMDVKIGHKKPINLFENYFLILSQLVFDTFCVLAMSAEVDTKITITTDQRNHLGEDIIEAGECQKSLVNEGLIPFQDALTISSTLEELENQALNMEIWCMGGHSSLESSGLEEEQRLQVE
ncbi:hypothetical protein L873DRAFT_1843598 [Choiromyces venosus 120613-1]|uniref:Uncharacterized protein n=1 Tax=Choiromyces venosus 120613-1 TaxID=1336337 RepID=A0A3N4JMM1_9PEZI|nr:hypothetical protein L873DRAFT_1843598 [Choiromyces venosus 120613-1]